MTWIKDAGLALLGGAGDQLTQEAFQNRNIRGQKEIGRFNQQLALDIWNKTNYEAQRKHMEKAGLNVGLMYKGAGEGGTTAGGQAGGVSPGPSKNLGLEAQQIAANTKLANAQALLAETQAHDIKGGEGTKGEADIAKTAAETANKKTEGQILEINRKIADNQLYRDNITMDEALNKIRAESQTAEAQARKTGAEAKESEETLESRIKQIKTNEIEQGFRILAQKKGLQATDAQIDAIKTQTANLLTDRQIEWRKLDQNQQQLEINKMIANLQKQNTEFNTSTPAQIKQWTDIATDIAKAAAQVIGATKK